MVDPGKVHGKEHGKEHPGAEPVSAPASQAPKFLQLSMRIGAYRISLHMSRVIPESSAAYVDVGVQDERNTLTAPTTLEWKLRCLTTNKEIVGWTAITDPKSVESIIIAATHNGMQSKHNEYEDKEVTIAANRGLSTQANRRDTYRVENLGGIE